MAKFIGFRSLAAWEVWSGHQPADAYRHPGGRLAQSFQPHGCADDEKDLLGHDHTCSLAKTESDRCDFRRYLCCGTRPWCRAPAMPLRKEAESRSHSTVAVRPMGDDVRIRRAITARLLSLSQEKNP